MAGLDPAIHHSKKILAGMMDTRVKPAYDAEYGLAPVPPAPAAILRDAR
jgi:hypothetical protein